MQFSLQDVPTTENQIGRLAAVISSQFNQQSQLGQDLNGAPGVNFFSSLSPTVIASTTNATSGGAPAETVTATFSDATKLQASDYSLQVVSGKYQLTRLSDGQHLRMSGYPSKTTSMSFSKGGKWLASSGSDAMVLWPFFGGGPMGKAPMELAGGDGIICTQVACNPKDDIVAGGFADGLVVVADITSSRILPVVPPDHGPISTLAWSPDGTQLAVGTETGFAALIDFARR